MSLLSNRHIPGHLAEAAIHFNRARDATASGNSMVEVARGLFDGLNKIQTEWALDQPDQEIREVKAFQSMVSEGLQSEARSAFLRSDELQSLVALQPQIMNHDVLRRRGYRPGVDIDPALIRDASEVHRRLANAHSELEGADAAIEERIIKRTAELLYIVRSNLAHGEKTLNGPDLAKTDRDEAVCSVIVPLQEILFELLLDRPTGSLLCMARSPPDSQTTTSSRASPAVGSTASCGVLFAYNAASPFSPGILQAQRYRLSFLFPRTSRSGGRGSTLSRAQSTDDT